MYLCEARPWLVRWSSGAVFEYEKAIESFSNARSIREKKHWFRRASKPTNPFLRWTFTDRWLPTMRDSWKVHEQRWMNGYADCSTRMWHEFRISLEKRFERANSIRSAYKYKYILSNRSENFVGNERDEQLSSPFPPVSGKNRTVSRLIATIAPSRNTFNSDLRTRTHTYVRAPYACSSTHGDARGS